MTESGDQRPPEDDKNNTKATLIAIIVVVVLLAAMIWVAQIFVEQQQLEKCIQSGRTNCVEIERPE